MGTKLDDIKDEISVQFQKDEPTSKSMISLRPGVARSHSIN